MRSPTTPIKRTPNICHPSIFRNGKSKREGNENLRRSLLHHLSDKNPPSTKNTALLYKSHLFPMTSNHWLKFRNKLAIYWLLDMLDIISSINNWSDDISIIYCYSQQYFSKFNQPFHQFFEIYFLIFLAFISQTTLVKDSATHLKSCWWEIRTLTKIMEMQLHLH